MLDHESYGLSVLKFREIIRLQRIMPRPPMPAFVNCVIRFRERVIPIADRRGKFGLKAEFAERTCIAVVQIRPRSLQTAQVGPIVDRPEEVATLATAEVEPTPEFGAKIDTSYPLGTAKPKGTVQTPLHLDRVVAPTLVQPMVATT